MFNINMIISLFKKIGKALIISVFFPFYKIYKTLNSESKTYIKIIKAFLIAIIIFPLWMILGSLILGVFAIALISIGAFPIPVPVVGSSMLPTITTKSNVNMHLYHYDWPILKRDIKRGDLVTFANENTLGEDYIKRVIGIGGDKIVIKNGYIYLNNKVLKEQYTLKGRSTFGGKKFSECKEITIPNGGIFVLGDNRKASKDSRDIGFVLVKDINYLLPFSEQQIYANKWRNILHDAEDLASSTLNIENYVKLLNKKREDYNLKPLKYEPKLSNSANLRAKAMLASGDFSRDGEKSHYSLSKSLKDVGYSNIVYGEFPVTGYYDENELIDYAFEFEDSKQFLLNKDYQDIGISTFIGDLNGCPTQIVTQHFGGYVPPNYSKDQISSWEAVLDNLRGVQNGWQELRKYESFYSENKADVDRINQIIDIRISNISKLVERMKANQWLTYDEKDYINQDEKLYSEQQSLAQKLNKL